MNSGKRTEKQMESVRRRSKEGGNRLAAVGMPMDADCRLPKVTVVADRFARVEHHTGVLKLTGCCVRLFSRLGIIRIEGEGLIASDMDDDLLQLDGKVKSVTFE
ncbi:MAG: YabP/YqfC family sporulation protein [Clostridia bacterium]|nr:YabP/YqfC family sporulation protein [Clostridia bacterium]